MDFLCSIEKFPLRFVHDAKALRHDLRETVHELDSERGIGIHEFEEIMTEESEENGCAHGYDSGGTGGVVEERDFAEKVAGREFRNFHAGEVGKLVIHLDCTIADDVQPYTWVSLADNDLALIEVADMHDRIDFPYLVFREGIEHGNGREEGDFTLQVGRGFFKRVAPERPEIHISTLYCYGD
jgi:hypothetical protein